MPSASPVRGPTTDELAACAPGGTSPPGQDRQERAKPAFFVLRVSSPGQAATSFGSNFSNPELHTRVSEILTDVLPVFLLILVGWVIVRTGLLKAEIGEAMSEFVFKIAVPLLLFQTIAEADFRGSSPFRLWIAYFSGVAITWTAGHIVATRMFGRDARIGVLAGVSSAFANTIFIGLPLVGRTVGPDGVMAMSILIAVHLPTMMIAGTLLMEQAERKENAGAGRSTAELLRQVGSNLMRNPLVIGLFCGLIVHLTSLPIPATLGTAVDNIANIAGPAALISLGMALRQYGMSGNLGITSVIAAFKLFLLPACVLAVGLLLGLSPEWRAALVLTAAVPTGVNAWLIANRFGVGHSLAASTITLTTALGAFSVSLWAYLLG